jgi:hypothetical protein
MARAVFVVAAPRKVLEVVPLPVIEAQLGLDGRWRVSEPDGGGRRSHVE